MRGSTKEIKKGPKMSFKSQNSGVISPLKKGKGGKKFSLKGKEIGKENIS